MRYAKLYTSVGHPITTAATASSRTILLLLVVVIKTKRYNPYHVYIYRKLLYIRYLCFDLLVSTFFGVGVRTVIIDKSRRVWCDRNAIYVGFGE